MDDLELALAVIIMRGDTDGDAGTCCAEHPIDNDPNGSGPRNIETLRSEITPGAMGHVYSGDDLPSPADINQANAAFWAARTGMTAGASPEKTPAPGSGEESKAQNFQPGAAKSINNARRLSTSQQSLDMGKTSG